jgi:hypothetical protein
MAISVVDVPDKSPACGPRLDERASFGRLATSWVFQKRAIGFPSRLAIEGARASVIGDRIGGTSASVCMRARVLIRPWNI